MSTHAWLPPGTDRNAQESVQRPYFQYYVGDNVDQNVDYAPASFSYGLHNFTWGSPVTNNWRNEPAEIGQAATVLGTGSNANLRRILKTEGVTLQSHFLGGRVVTTFGLRKDQSYSQNGPLPRLLPDGMSHDREWDNQWGDWTLREGRTETAGIVVRPLKWLGLHANKSNSFQPEAPAMDIYGNRLPDPRNEGTDVGFSLNLLGGKLIVRATQYTTKQLGTRTTNLIATVRNVEIQGTNLSRNFGLNSHSRTWIRNANPSFTEAQLDQAVADLMKVSLQQLNDLEDLTVPLADSNDVTAKGREIEINYNPNNYWTLKLNLAEQESINTAMSDSLARYVNERLPLWMSIIDTDVNAPWFTWDYNNNRPSPTAVGSAKAYLDLNFWSRFNLSLAQLGKSLPQIRKYRANISTNYRLAGLTDHRILKRFNVGGALRWEDKGAIGYYGLQQLPAMITDLDPNRPIWSPANLRADAFIGYRTRLFADKVTTTVQLNVRNIQDSGKLQAISAYL